MSNVPTIEGATTETILNVVLETVQVFRIHSENSHPVRNKQNLHPDFVLA